MEPPSFGSIETQGPIFLLFHVLKVTLWSKAGTGTAAGKDRFQAGRSREGKRETLEASPAELVLFV